MLVYCLFCRSVATYQQIAVVSFAENGRFFSRQDGSDNQPFDKTSKNSISRFWFLVTRRKRCYFELIIVRAERAYQESGGYTYLGIRC